MLFVVYLFVLLFVFVFVIDSRRRKKDRRKKVWADFLRNVEGGRRDTSGEEGGIKSK
jgi:hypothetical protein